MTELFDLILNGYLRIFVGLVIIGLIGFSLYFSFKNKQLVMDKVIPVLYMIGVLILVLPAFLQSNSKSKIFFKNLSIWTIIVLIILTIAYFVK